MAMLADIREPNIRDGLRPDCSDLPACETELMQKPWTSELFGDGSHWLVAMLVAVLTVSIFTASWHIDEGVISLFTDYFQKTGDLRYLFQHHNCRFSFSWPYFYLLALVRGNPLDADTYYLLRVPSLILCVASLLAVNESLRAFVRHRTIRILALVFFAACCLQLGATGARYDSPYLFGASMALLAAARLHQGRSWLWTCPALLAVAFAGTSHPVGLGAVGFMGIVVLYYCFARPASRREAAIVASVAAASAALMVAGLLIDRTPGEFLADLKGVQDQYHTFTSNTVHQEKYRYLAVLQAGGLVAKIFVACIFLGVLWPAGKEHRSGVRCCRLGLWALVVFLALIPTKWTFYIGLLLPCATVLGAHHVAAVWSCRVFPSRLGWIGADGWLQFRGVRLSQVLALGLAAYLGFGIGYDLWSSAHANTLLARLLRPNGKQAAMSRQWAQFLAGKSINLYSDMTILPLLGTADFQRHCFWQPDVGIGEEIELGDSGEYLVVSERHRGGTYGYVERHSQLSRFPPQKIMTACFFNDTFTIYRINQTASAKKQARLNEPSTASVDPDARLQ